MQFLAIGLVLTLAFIANTQAQPYPARPIRLIIPQAPGGSIDILTRYTAQRVSQSIGQQVVIDNRTGAGGMIGVEVTANSAPDGYTLVIGSSGTHAINLALHKKLSYDPVKDFAPVTVIASTPYILVVPVSLPASSVKELLALAKAKPGRLNYASSGNGTAPHLAAELFKTMAGVSITHIPYKGSAPALTDLLAGQVDMFFAGIPTTFPHIKAGKLRALAATSAKRVQAMPDLPTVAESGMPGFETVPWFGVFAPAGTPKLILDKLHEHFTGALKSREIREQFAVQGAEPVGNTREEFQAYVKAEILKWAKVVKESGAKID